jgi:hypothetical protein
MIRFITPSLSLAAGGEGRQPATLAPRKSVVVFRHGKPSTGLLDGALAVLNVKLGGCGLLVQIGETLPSDLIATEGVEA